MKGIFTTLYLLMTIQICAQSNVQLNIAKLRTHIQNTPQNVVNQSYVTNFNSPFVAYFNPNLIKSHVNSVSFEERIWITPKGFKSLEKSFGFEKNVNSLIFKKNKFQTTKNRDEEFKAASKTTDDLGIEHTKFEQFYKGVKIYGSQVIAHSKGSTIKLINGHRMNVKDLDILPTISNGMAIEVVQKMHPQSKFKTTVPSLLETTVTTSELVIYPFDETFLLAYRIIYFPNPAQRNEYFVDAHTGQIIHYREAICKLYHDHGVEEHVFSGPTVATEKDLLGTNRQLQVYEGSGVYYLLDVSRNMFNASISELPNSPVGGILTLDAANTSPVNDDFSVDHISNRTNVWGNPNAVSAHINAGIAYEYFRQKFTRDSYDGKGASILSIINVADENGGGMDNAFWNGSAMFYGSGDVAFNRPLAASLDVASHELSHAVIERTANLVYEGESGALNESFADIFGVLVDRDDWTLGESVVNSRVFRTGALRSMQDPNNGGTSLNDNGYQPKNVSQQYRGTDDNGGVHINSGIANYAFYLFANNQAVGKDIAEKVYYRALTVYLVSTSDFKDLRLAVIQSVTDLYGANSPVRAAAVQAFDSVGILADGSGATVPDTDVSTIETNKGDDFVVYFRETTNELVLHDVKDDRDVVLSAKGVINVPSVSDDGSVVLFVDDLLEMNAITIDWQTGETANIVLEKTLKWRNVAISKDGTKIAGVTGDLSNEEFDNRIFVADLVSDRSKWFTLKNPTSSQNISTGEVLFADRLEWDHTGESIMYDASNEITSLFNDPIEYWDIGFIRVWNKGKKDFSDGKIFKLFPSLPENISIGDPVFAKNTGDIIALDVIDKTTSETTYTILGVNLLTGDQGVIFESSELGYPSFSRQDDAVVFNFTQNNRSILGLATLNNDKISSDEAVAFITNATWGVWFGNAARNLSTGIQEPILGEAKISIFPNPVSNLLTFDVSNVKCDPCEVQIRNTMGQLSQIDYFKGNQSQLNLATLTSGTYIITLRNSEGVFASKFVKL